MCMWPITGSRFLSQDQDDRASTNLETTVSISMSRVVDIDKNKPVWDTVLCVCLGCGKQWVGVIHMDHPRAGFECAFCDEDEALVQAVAFRSIEDKPDNVIQNSRRGFDFTLEPPSA